MWRYPPGSNHISIPTYHPENGADAHSHSPRRRAAQEQASANAAVWDTVPFAGGGNLHGFPEGSSSRSDITMQTASCRAEPTEDVDMQGMFDDVSNQQAAYAQWASMDAMAYEGWAAGRLPSKDSSTDQSMPDYTSLATSSGVMQWSGNPMNLGSGSLPDGFACGPSSMNKVTFNTPGRNGTGSSFFGESSTGFDNHGTFVRYSRRRCLPRTLLESANRDEPATQENPPLRQPFMDRLPEYSASSVTHSLLGQPYPLQLEHQRSRLPSQMLQPPAPATEIKSRKENRLRAQHSLHLSNPSMLLRSSSSANLHISSPPQVHSTSAAAPPLLDHPHGHHGLELGTTGAKAPAATHGQGSLLHETPHKVSQAMTASTGHLSFLPAASASGASGDNSGNVRYVPIASASRSASAAVSTTMTPQHLRSGNDGTGVLRSMTMVHGVGAGTSHTGPSNTASRAASTPLGAATTHSAIRRPQSNQQHYLAVPGSEGHRRINDGHSSSMSPSLGPQIHGSSGHVREIPQDNLSLSGPDITVPGRDVEDAILSPLSACLAGATGHDFQRTKTPATHHSRMPASSLSRRSSLSHPDQQQGAMTPNTSSFCSSADNPALMATAQTQRTVACPPQLLHQRPFVDATPADLSSTAATAALGVCTGMATAGSMAPGSAGHGAGAKHVRGAPSASTRAIDAEDEPRVHKQVNHSVHYLHVDNCRASSIGECGGQSGQQEDQQPLQRPPSERGRAPVSRDSTKGADSGNTVRDSHLGNIGTPWMSADLVSSLVTVGVGEGTPNGRASIFGLDGAVDNCVSATTRRGPDGHDSNERGTTGRKSPAEYRVNDDNEQDAMDVSTGLDRDGSRDNDSDNEYGDNDDKNEGGSLGDEDEDDSVGLRCARLADLG